MSDATPSQESHKPALERLQPLSATHNLEGKPTMLTKQPTKQTITIEIDSTSLLEVQAMLEQIHTAARAGDLDVGGPPHFNIWLEFATVNHTQDFSPLEEFLDRAERLWGVQCSYHFNFDREATANTAQKRGE